MEDIPVIPKRVARSTLNSLPSQRYMIFGMVKQQSDHPFIEDQTFLPSSKNERKNKSKICPPQVQFLAK